MDGLLLPAILIGLAVLVTIAERFCCNMIAREKKRVALLIEEDDEAEQLRMEERRAEREHHTRVKELTRQI